jgi:hypothetical protein
LNPLSHHAIRVSRSIGQPVSARSGPSCESTNRARVCGARWCRATGSRASKLQKLLDKIKDFLAKLKTWFTDLKTNFKEITDTKKLQSRLAQMDLNAANAAGGRAGWATRLHGAEGMVGQRITAGAGTSFAAEAKKAAWDSVGLKKATDRGANRQTPGDAKTWAQTGVDVGKKAYTYGNGANKANTYDETGEEQTKEKTSDNLDF